MSALFRKFASKYYLQFGQVCRIHLRCQWPETASYKASASATAVPTDYCGNMIYENGVLKQVLVDGGYMTVTGTPFYFYYLKDHLGSNRVVVSPAGTATQINHYYPFGGLFGESTGNTGQRYKYNGKEFDRTHGLDWYDYGARHMSPDVGRFTTIDPMAEKYYNISPYAYCGNNPINAIDPDGKDIWDVDVNGNIANYTETDEYDMIRMINSNQEFINSLKFKYGTISHQTMEMSDGTNYEVFRIEGNENGRDIFEMLAQNTDVEWSLAQFDKTANIPNILTTSHSEDSEGGVGNYLFNNKSLINNLSRLDHNHPGGSIQPSFRINDRGVISGDIGQVLHYKEYYPNNHINYNIYTLNDGKWGYYNYNDKSSINNGSNYNYLPNIIVYGNQK